ncbi:hypothetical protein FRB99_005111 [Tulasnella sp. 403]|nr:hypothetical protein FRB99_005111 [Tulasnella sp. 403]
MEESPSPAPQPFPQMSSPQPLVPVTTSRYSTTPIASVAARKAALLEKFTGSANSKNGSSPSSVASATKLPITSPSFTPTDWARSVSGTLSVDVQRERRDTLISNYSLPRRLSPMPTGSTVASTAVEMPLGPDGVRALPTMSAVGSRVRMAVMALNAMEKPVEGPSWRIGDPERSSTSMGSRSWSRLSIATKVGDNESSMSYSPGKPDMQEDTSYTSLAPSLSTSTIASANTSGNGTSYLTPLDESFDTHPPDMISPRTSLALAILPPWLRRRSTIDSETPPTSPPKKPLSIKQSESDVEMDDEEAEERDVPAPLISVTVETVPDADIPMSMTPPRPSPSMLVASPSPSPKPTPSVSQPIRRTTKPVMLRGLGKPPSRPASTMRSYTTASHSRSGSLAQSVTSIAPSERVRPRPASVVPRAPPPRNFTPNPTKIVPFDFESRPRRPSSVLSMASSAPVTVRAQNKVPLRKVSTNAPKPMRFSMAF